MKTFLFAISLILGLKNDKWIPMNQAVKIGIERQYHNIGSENELKNIVHLHEIHVVQSYVVKLRVLDDGGGARVVGRVDQGQHLDREQHYTNFEF